VRFGRGEHDLVEAPAAKACQVDGYVSETEMSEPINDRRAKIGLEEPGQIGGRDLYPGDLIVVPQAQFREPAFP
jgi:hypothetical protein